MKQLPKAVLFDFDGVVVDSFETHYAAWSSAFSELFDADIAPFPFHSHAGKSPYLIAQYFCEQIDKKESYKELFFLKGEHLHNSIKSPNLLPGVNEIEGFLTEKNIPYGIASNATKQFVANSIEQLQLGFITFFGVEDYEFPKPHPEAYISLAKELSIEEHHFANVWVFEDSLTGTKAAVDAGMCAIGILTQYSELELRNAGSQMVFPTLLEAYNYLKG